MQRYDSLDRKESLMRMVPELFDYTCLYVGARHDRKDFLDDFKTVTVMEVWKPNALLLDAQGYNVLYMDVRDLNIEDCYECVFWWHGPEHIKRRELRPTLERLEQIASKVVVLGCPWGYFHQGAIDGNPYEEHLTDWNYRAFERFGYKVECLGHYDERGSNITAVKYV